jgi:hypothetical protein
MSENRIGAACWYRTYIAATQQLSEWKRGRLRAWSTDCIEGEAGFGNYPVGVVEDDVTLCCESVPVGWICFAAVPGGEQ